MLRQARDFMRRFPQVHHAIRSVWSPPKSIYQHLYFDGVISVDVAPGVSFQLECHGEHIENEFFWRGFGNTYEGKSLKLWMELAKGAGHVADIGANSGIYSLVAKALRPSAKVIAIEPSPRVLEKLQRNIKLNGFSIKTVEIAASDRTGTATFYDFPTAHQYTGSLEKGFGGSVATIVRVETMDDILAQNEFDKLDLVKIDVELHEPAVLRGMRKSLERWKPTLLVEILNPDVGLEVRDAVAGLNYHIAAVGVSDSPHPTSDARNFLIAQKPVFDGLAITVDAITKVP